MVTIFELLKTGQSEVEPIFGELATRIREVKERNRGSHAAFADIDEDLEVELQSSSISESSFTHPSAFRVTPEKRTRISREVIDDFDRQVPRK